MKFLKGLLLLLAVHLFDNLLEEHMEHRRFQARQWFINILLLGAVLMLLSSLLGCASAVSTDQVANRLAIRRNVVVESGHNFGSGVIIQRGKVLTAAHMLDDTAAIYVNRIKATVLKRDKNYDLMILSVPTEDLPQVVLARSVSVAENVFYVGNPIGKVGYVSIGNVTWMDSTLINTSMLPMPGSSGGGVYNLRGQLVGINSFIQSPNTLPIFIAAAVPMSRIQKFLGPRFIIASEDGTAVKPP